MLPPETVNLVSSPFEVIFISNTDDWPVTTNTIAKWTYENTVTKPILECVSYEFRQKISLFRKIPIILLHMRRQCGV